MNKRLKGLFELRGAKVKEARELIDKAITEKRQLTVEENGKVNSAQSEVEGIDAQIQTETRQISIEASRAPIGTMSDDEKRSVDSFDLGRAIRILAGNEKRDGIEAEMLDEGSREARSAQIPTKGGLVLPRCVLQKRDMTATTGTDLQYGGAAIATQKMGILDAFYNALVLRQAGAQFVTGAQGNIDIPCYVAPTAPSPITENYTASEMSPELSLASLSPKRLGGYINVSDQLLIQTGGVIEAVVRRNTLAQLTSRCEYYAFHGAGGSAPTGILSTTSIGNVIGGTNGAAPTWANIVSLESKVAAENADIGTLHYVSNTKVRGQLKATAKISTSDSMTILDDRNGGLLNGYTPLWTNNVSSTLTKGSSGAVASAIIFGQFSSLWMVFWGGMEIDLIRDLTLAKDGQRALVFNTFFDCVVDRYQSFAAMKDALTSSV
jgi:HK97 family phage major capsid protein